MRLHTGTWKGPAIMACLALALGACGGDDDGDAEPVSNPSSPPASGGASAAPPTLSGNPQKQAKVGQNYTFQPTASSSNGSGSLSFSISGKPAWASFNGSNGRLTGTPGQGDVGLHSGIVISASNSVGTSSLGSFAIEVVDVGQVSVTLSWMAPTENEDGTPLTDLAGYKIRFGQSSGDYQDTINLGNPGINTYVVEGLVPSTYYFVVSAYNTAGAESDYSNEAVVQLSGS